MKVLLVSVRNKTAHGGIAVWTESYLRGCATHGVEVDLVNIQMHGRRAVDGTARRSLMEELHRTKDIFAQLFKYLKYPSNYDVAHLNTSCGTFGLIRDLMIARQITKKGIPLVTHYHCDISNCIEKKYSRRCLEKLARSSKHNLVLNENSRQCLKEQFGLDSAKIPNFIDASLVLRAEKNTREILKRVFFVGRVELQKGAAEIYELARRYPEMLFTLVGEVNEEIAQWDKPGNVELLGGMSHEQVIEQMDQSDVFIFPSHSEGFSVALMESMARGLPAIATDVGAAADMLADGCGIVVPKGDVDAMEQALRSLEDQTTRQRISRSASNKVCQHYSTEAVIQLIMEYYK